MEMASLWVASTWQYSCAWVCKLSNKPGRCNLVKTVAQGWKLEQTWRLHEQYPSYHQMANDFQLQIQAEQEAQATVISYADWLVTTMNDALPQSNWTVPSPHPSAISKTTKPLIIQWSAIQSVVQHAALRLNLGSSHHADFIFQRICRMKLLLTLNSSGQQEVKTVN